MLHNEPLVHDTAAVGHPNYDWVPFAIIFAGGAGLLVWALSGSRGGWCGLGILLGIALGYILTRYSGTVADTWALSHFGIDRDETVGTGLPSKHIPTEWKFLSFTAFSAVAYSIFFSFATNGVNDPDHFLPIAWEVLSVTAIAAAFFSAHTVRYAAYIRSSLLLEAAVIDRSREKAAGKLLPAQLNELGRLRRAVFRGENMYEPAGNIFVTIGLTATFLGLAIALVNFDLVGMVQRSADTISDQASLAPTAPGDIAPMNPQIRALKAFVSYMGLALGMSMLGVLTALSAQWLRGYGPTETTEELLARAQQLINPPATSLAGTDTTAAAE